MVQSATALLACDREAFYGSEIEARERALPAGRGTAAGSQLCREHQQPRPPIGALERAAVRALKIGALEREFFRRQVRIK